MSAIKDQIRALSDHIRKLSLSHGDETALTQTKVSELLPGIDGTLRSFKMLLSEQKANIAANKALYSHKTHGAVDLLLTALTVATKETLDFDVSFEEKNTYIIAQLVKTMGSSSFLEQIEDKFTFETFTDPVMMDEEGVSFMQTVERSTLREMLSRSTGGFYNKPINPPDDINAAGINDTTMLDFISFVRLITQLNPYLATSISPAPALSKIEPTETTPFLKRTPDDPPVKKCWARCAIL